jgi:BACON domain-containing protein/all-beta uncharacterized protein
VPAPAPVPAPTGTFTLGRTSASFDMVEAGTPASAQSVPLTITGTGVAFVGAAYLAGQSPANWLNIDIQGAGNSYVMSLSVGYLPAGNYTATFAVGTADANGVVLQRQDFTVQLRVHRRLQIDNATYIQRSYRFGDASRTETVPMDVLGPDRPWSAYSTVPWIHVPTDARTGNQSTQATIDITGLGPGNYSGTVGVRDNADASNSQGMQVSLIITEPTFTTTQQELLFGGVNGTEALTVLPVNFTLTTGNGVHPYAATVTTDSDGAWLQLSNPMGTVGAAGSTINLSVAPGSLPGATRTAQLRLTTNVYGTTYTALVPVTWNYEWNRLVVSASGVGFSSLPGRSVLTRTVRVFGAAHHPGTPWTAQSDSAWLTVTPSGTTDGDLTLTANPAGLAAETTHFANVSVSSSDPLVANSQSIRVSLYKSGIAPVTTHIDRVATHVAASPVEPLVAITGGPGTDVMLHNVYSGALVRTLAGVAAGPAAIKFSGDGRQLFVHDEINLNVRKVDAVSGAQLASYDATSISPTYRGYAVETVRPGGEELLITPGGRVYDVGSDTYFANAPYFAAVLALSLNHSPDQSLVAPQFGTVARFRRTALRGGGLEIDSSAYSVYATDTGETCFSANGDRVYSPYFTGNPHHIVATSLATGQIMQQYPTELYPAAVRCVWNGLVVGGAEIANNNADDVVTFHGPTGVGRGTLKSSVGVIYPMSLLRRGLEVSADGTRLISLYGSYVNTDSVGVSLQSLPTPQ